MQKLLIAIDVVIGFIALGGFIPACIAHVSLCNSFDPSRLDAKSRPNTTHGAQCLMAPIECFDEEDQGTWRIRDRGFKAFALAAFLFVILSVVSAVLDIPIAPPK